MDINVFCDYIGITVTEIDGILCVSSFSEKYVRIIYDSNVSPEYFSYIMKIRGVDIDDAIILITQSMNDDLKITKTEFSYFINSFFPKKLYRKYKIKKIKND